MKRCGLLGEKLGHSYSPAIHAELADYEYRLYEVAPEKLGEFLESGSFDGLNVTIPYKKAVIAYCAELSPIAQKLRSVNVLVKRPDGTLYGDNADAYGFAGMVKASGIAVAGKKTLVLGSGGASATVCAVLEELGARSVTVISRSGENHYGNLDRHAGAEVIVNATPVGMYPDCGVSPLDLAQFPKLEGVLDIVYNPARTALVLQAERLGISYMSGLYMLVAQAKRTAEVFEGREIPDSETERILKKLSLEMQNIVLIGMPGSGKSTVAARLAEALDRVVLDSDAEIEEKNGASCAQLIERHGEAAFRKLETEALAALGKRSGAVIATGGGCVTREENYDLLHQNGVIFWLERDVDKLPREGRPLSAGDLKALYDRRRACYERFAVTALFCVQSTVRIAAPREGLCVPLRAGPPVDHAHAQGERFLAARRRRRGDIEQDRAGAGRAAFKTEQDERAVRQQRQAYAPAAAAAQRVREHAGEFLARAERKRQRLLERRGGGNSVVHKRSPRCILCTGAADMKKERAAALSFFISAAPVHRMQRGDLL